MRLRVKYNEHFHCWFGEEYDDLLGSWYTVTNPCYTKWGAKRELRSLYKYYSDHRRSKRSKRLIFRN